MDVDGVVRGWGVVGGGAVGVRACIICRNMLSGSGAPGAYLTLKGFPPSNISWFCLQESLLGNNVAQLHPVCLGARGPLSGGGTRQ